MNYARASQGSTPKSSVASGVATSEAVIAFDFWGAGNFGDDLMMDGFLRALKYYGFDYEERLVSFTSSGLASQRIRFPHVKWVGTDEGMQDTFLASSKVILGVGDTPFQYTCGDWFLRRLEQIVETIADDAQLVFINVGAEEEALEAGDGFGAVLGRVNRCSTRDAMSLSVLKRLGRRADDRLCQGGDLAGISLQAMSANIRRDRRFRLGVILGHDTFSERDLDAAKIFLEGLPGPIAFITGDSRDGSGFEYQLFRSWTKRWFSPLRKKLILMRPHYDSCALKDLIQPIAECDVILSSRFHGILAAAWMGCRVAAIGRSSKVVALAHQFGIPCVHLPLNISSIKVAVENATVVDCELLEAHRKMALQGVLACKFW